MWIIYTTSGNDLIPVASKPDPMFSKIYYSNYRNWTNESYLGPFVVIFQDLCILISRIYMSEDRLKHTATLGSKLIQSTNANEYREVPVRYQSDKVTALRTEICFVSWRKSILIERCICWIPKLNTTINKIRRMFSHLEQEAFVWFSTLFVPMFTSDYVTDIYLYLVSSYSADMLEANFVTTRALLQYQIRQTSYCKI